MVKYNVLSYVFNALSCVFPSISYNFLYICTSITRISLHICIILRFASFFIFCTFVQTFSTHCTKIALAKCHSLYKLFGTFAQTFSSLPPHFFQLVRNFMTICFQLPCKTSQLPSAFSYATTAFSLHFVSVSTAFSTRNVSASTMFLACIAYASTMFLIHNIYLSITKCL